MKFGIVSDSSCDLSLQYARQEQVTIVSFYVSFDGEKYMKEGKEIAVTDFYQEMADNPDCYPKTSMPSVQDYIDAFLPFVCPLCGNNCNDQKGDKIGKMDAGFNCHAYRYCMDSQHIVLSDILKNILGVGLIWLN